MNLTNLIQRPIAVLTILCGLLALSLIVLRVIPVSLLPEANIPQLTVQISYPSATALELEQNVVQPIRNQLLQVNRLRDIRSQSQNGRATLYLDFDYGSSINLAFIETNEKLDQLMSLLPRDLERPRVLKAGVTDIPVFYLHVVPQRADPLELAEFARAILKRRMEQLPEIAFVDLSGFAQAEIRIQPEPGRWQSLGLNADDLRRILQENNLDLGSVLVQDGQYQYNIRFQSALRSVADLENIYFQHRGQVLRLGDLARIEPGPQARQGAVLHHTNRAIVFAVHKQADAQLFALKKNFGSLLTSFRSDYPDLNFYVSNDQSELLAVSIDNLRTSLLYGACFAILIMFFFFRDWRAPVLIGLAVPLALLLSVLGFYLLGLSINIISLSGLILGVGLMIDNSIIVIENIRQYRAMGHSPTEAGVQGAREVIRPLISSALTTCSVFVPLVFLSGLAGALFYDQALSISIALGMALLLAYFLLPTLWRLLDRGHPYEKKTQAEHGRPDFFTRSVDFVLDRRWLFLLFFLGILGSMYFPLRQLQQETFPPLSRKALQVDIDWNSSLSFAENEKRVQSLITEFEPYTTTATAQIGSQQFLLATETQSSNEAQIIYFFAEANRFPDTALRQKIQQNYPEASLRIAPLENVFDQVFGATAAPLSVQLQSNRNQEPPSPEQLQPVVDFLNQREIFPALPPLEEQLAISINRQQVLRYGLSQQQVVTALQGLFSDYQLEQLNTGNALVPIMLSGPQVGLYQRLNEATLRNAEGQALPLRQFIQTRPVQSYKTIEAGVSGVAIRLDLPRYDPVLMEDLRAFIRAETELSVTFNGQAFEDRRTVRELSIILGIALLLLYLILAAQFESLVQPFIVMLTVPISLMGTLFLLWWSRQSINLVSIIGMIVMSGIVVNDAILKVDMMNRLRQSQDLRGAIHGAGQRRLKSILMTSLTTILALLPILFTTGLGAELQRPLAFAVIGGLTVGTLSSLYFIPLIYGLIYSDKHKSTLDSPTKF